MPTPRDWVSALAMIAIVAACGLQGVLQTPGSVRVLQMTAGGALAVFILAEMGRAQPGARLIALVCALAAAGIAAVRPDAAGILVSALAGAAGLAAFFAALGFLHLAAKTSPLIERCGTVMVRQPPSRRYLSLTLGAHLISLVLSFGVLNLLGLMVTQGNTLEAAGGDPDVVAVRKARMMSALLRGFIAMVLWSPLSVSFTVIHGVIPNLEWGTLIPLQMGLAASVTAIGWLVDRRAYPPRAIPLPALPPVPGGNRALMQLGAVVAAMMAGVMAVAVGLKAAPIVGIIFVIPVAAFVWLVVQNRDMETGAVYQAAKSLGLRLGAGLPESRNEVMYLGGAMFLGLAASALLGNGAAAPWVAMLPLSPLWLTIALPWLVMILAQLGVPQIFSVTLLGGALPALAPLGIHPLALASGLMGAWALSSGSTPVGAAVSMIARQADVPVRMVTLRWNGVFVLVSALFLGVWVAGVSWIFG